MPQARGTGQPPPESAAAPRGVEGRDGRCQPVRVKLALQPFEVIAIVPPPLTLQRYEEEPREVVPVLGWWTRRSLVLTALALTVVFGLALWLNPYDEKGRPRTMETHRQLGLPPCTFHFATGVPCPSCGMTTSFALLMRGDVINSLRANSVGTLLALFWLALIPWSLLSAWRSRPVFIVSLERAVTWAVIVFLVLLLVRWGVVVGLSQLAKWF